jgi:hypothetical protein
MKAYPSAAPADLARFADSLQRQQLFGVERPGISHFARRLDRLSAPTLVQRMQKTGERIAYRLLPLNRTPPRG